MRRILVVDGEDARRSSFIEFLSSDETVVVVVATASELFAAVAEYPVDIVIVGLNIPDGDILSALPELRKTSPGTAVAALTSPLMDEHLVEVYGAGADVYLCDNSPPLLIAAVIKAMLARNSAPRVGGLNEDSRWSLDFWSFKLVAPNGKSLDLSRSEHLLLYVLMDKWGRMCRRESVAAALLKTPSKHTDQSVSVQVSRLRKRVSSLLEMPLPIRGKLGGYVFFAPAGVYYGECES